jgi:dTDP-4-amino-4,6-dideoxygalactose transaminase
MKVPLFDIKRQIDQLKSELMAEIERVLDSGGFILGPEVEAFETAIRAYTGAGHAIGVASGTDALWLALRALDIGPGDYVLTSPFTFFATASAILNTGATPLFADIIPDTFNIDPEEVRLILEGDSNVIRRQGIRPDAIKALMPVHLFGQSADMEQLLFIARDYGLPVVEDAAQGLGAHYKGRKLGTLGDIGCFSFFPTKNLGAFGDAGMVTTNDAELAEKIRLLRAHGAKPKYYHHVVGANSRLDALQAALLRVKLRYLDTWVEARQDHATAYNQALASVVQVQTPVHAAHRSHSYHQYTIRVAGEQRSGLEASLSTDGVGTALYYPVPLHLQPALAAYGFQAGDYPEAESACNDVLSLPIFPELKIEERDHVVSAITHFFDELSAW